MFRSFDKVDISPSLKRCVVIAYAITDLIISLQFGILSLLLFRL